MNQCFSSFQIRTPHGTALYFNSKIHSPCTSIRLRPGEESSNILLVKRFPLLLNKLNFLKDFRSKFTKAISGSTYSTTIKYMNKVEVFRSFP